MMDLFRGRVQAMIATEAGGEGINLQFCHHMINFDLPWNPMRVEQAELAGSIALGKENDVNIFNLSTKGTIEEHILNLPHEKINMFEMVIGGLDVILERLEQKESIEKACTRSCWNPRTKRNFATKWTHWGSHCIRFGARLRMRYL